MQQEYKNWSYNKDLGVYAHAMMDKVDCNSDKLLGNFILMLLWSNLIATLAKFEATICLCYYGQI